MKNIKIFCMLLASLVALSGCSKSDNNGGKNPGKETLVGEWHMVSWTGATATADIYISFTEEGTFDLYQRFITPGYVPL